MEAPKPSDPVAHNAVAVHHCRPGSAVGSGEGVFQPALLGEYDYNRRTSLPDDCLHSSRNHHAEPSDSSSLAIDGHRSNDLLVYYQNAGGMNSNIFDYRLACLDCSYDVIALTESWLDDRTTSNQAFGSGYEVFRCDRCRRNSRKTTGGGVLVAVRRELKARLLQTDHGVNVEQVWVAIKLVDHTLFFCVVYLPPDRTRDLVLISSHTDSVASVSSLASPRDEIVVLGDYNLPDLKWSVSSNGYLYADPAHSAFHIGSICLLDNYSTALLKQTNNVVNENGRLLDLCFVSAQDPAPSISEAPTPLVKLVAHHPPLHVVLEKKWTSDLADTPACVRYNFRKADYPSIMAILFSVDWENVLDSANIDMAVQTFTNIIGYVIDRHVPKVVASSTEHHPWETAALRRLKTAKRKALRKYSRRKTVTLREHYKRLNHEYKRHTQQCFSNYRRNIQRKLKSNPKLFWNYVREQRKECGLPSSMSFNGEVGSDTNEICRLFASKFSSVFSGDSLTPAQIATAADMVPSSGRSLHDIFVHDSSILTAASKLKTSFSPGPDGIPSVVIKKCIVSLLEPLGRIFRLSLSAGRFPRSWKMAYMFPVHKKGDRQNIDNYRGISSLCATSKLFELLVLEPVFFHCKQYISNDQHGFMPKRSTATNLLTFTSYVTEGFADRIQTDAIYTDLSAAFDKINHDIAIAKLGKLGICGSLLNWFQSYLTGRRIEVNLDNVFSGSFPATSGIPQGSHLGPLIFVLYFNDVNIALEGPRLSYADDMKIFYHIKNTDDALFLQQQLQNFDSWCKTNCMVLNPHKCSVVTFAWMKQPIIFDYKLSHVSLVRESSVKDLGVILDSKLTFKQHVSYIVNKASRTLGFIFRTAKGFSDVFCLKALYCSLVRSSLEYCSTVWNPQYQNGALRIEAVQRRFTRFALRHATWPESQQPPSYELRCQNLQLDTLQVRRDVSRALLVADLLTSRIDCPSLLERISLFARPRALRNNTLLRIPFRRTNYGANGAINGLQRIFNQVLAGFDFMLSRFTIKRNFFSLLRRLRT